MLVPFFLKLKWKCTLFWKTFMCFFVLFFLLACKLRVNGFGCDLSDSVGLPESNGMNDFTWGSPLLIESVLRWFHRRLTASHLITKGLVGAKCLETWLTGVCADPWFHLFLIVGWVGGDISLFSSQGWVRLCLHARLWTGQGHCQVGSLAGAAHLLKSNAGVQRRAQQEQKSCVEQKGKSSFDFDFQYK